MMAVSRRVKAAVSKKADSFAKQTVSHLVASYHCLAHHIAVHGRLASGANQDTLCRRFVAHTELCATSTLSPLRRQRHTLTTVPIHSRDSRSLHIDGDKLS